MKKTQLYLILLFSTLIIQACGSGYTILERNPAARTVVNNNHTEQLNSIARVADNQQRKNRIEKLNIRLYEWDPVFINLNAAVLLYDKQYNEAAKTYADLIKQLKRYGHNFYAFSTEMPELLANHNRLNTRNRIIEEDIYSILNGLNILVQTGNRMRLLMALESLTGELPSQPIYEGVSGLALEALDQFFRGGIFRPKLFPYNSVLIHSENITAAALDITYQNLFIAQLLAEDYDGLRSTINEIQRLPYRSRSAGLEFYLTLGLFLENNPGWRQSNNRLSSLLRRYQ